MEACSGCGRCFICNHLDHKIPQPTRQDLLIRSENQDFFNSQIIAILAAILFPVFARAREKARQTSCLSNLKQIGLAHMMYAQDYDERFAPYEVNHGSSLARASATYDTIHPYINNEQVYICPSAEWTYIGHASGTTRSEFPSGVGVFRQTMLASYSIIRDMSGADRVSPTPFPSSGRKMAQFTRPAQTIMVFETGGGYLGNKSNVGFYDDDTPRPMDANGNVGVMRYRHNMQMNVVYADGHAKSIPQLTDINALKAY